MCLVSCFSSDDFIPNEKQGSLAINILLNELDICLLTLSWTTLKQIF